MNNEHDNVHGDEPSLRPTRNAPPVGHKPPTDVSTRQARTNARQAAETTRANAKQGKHKGKVKRNEPGQETHAAREHVAHDENTDRDTDDLYDTERENEVTEWKRHSALDAPAARPGYVNRFIRVRLGTTRDMARWQAAQREGWRPVKASSVTDRSLPTTTLQNGTDVIGVEDLVLCEMPEKVFEQRQRFYRKKLQSQNAAIERQLREQSAPSATGGFGPIEQTRQSSVSVRAPGRSRGVAADD